MTTRLPESKCRECGFVLTAASHLEDDTRRPHPGDFSVCIKCGTLGVFDAGLRIVAPTAAERDIAKSMPEIVAHQRVVRRLRAAHMVQKLGHS